MRIGNGAVIATGYLASVSGIAGAGVANNLATVGFPFTHTAGVIATAIFHHTFTLTLLDPATFKWLCVGLGNRSDISANFIISGSLALTSVLDRARITTAAGTDTFDAGSVNISWEF